MHYYWQPSSTTQMPNVIHLPEDNFIGAYGVADAAGDNAGNYEPESPLHFSFDSTIQVIDNDKKYFPIQVSYSGEKPNADYSSIEPTNQQLIVNYNPEKKEYQ